jgi:hypothetical protein
MQRLAISLFCLSGGLLVAMVIIAIFFDRPAVPPAVTNTPVSATRLSTVPVPEVPFPDRLTLYSLEPARMVINPKTNQAEPFKADEDFHGFPVLGKVEITDLAQRKEIIAALVDGLTDNDDVHYHCFMPRHGLKTIRGSAVIDSVICFQCYGVLIYSAGERQSFPLNSAPQEVLNRHLSAAGVPLAEAPPARK